MVKMAVVAHGGAGPGPERQTNLQRAVDEASRLLLSGASAVQAAVEACVILEDDPVFNAGTGGVFRNDGSVLLDASIQTSDGRIGFVIAMSDTPNPIRVAADLLDESINGLTGPGLGRGQMRGGMPIGPLRAESQSRGMEIPSESLCGIHRGQWHVQPVPADVVTGPLEE